MWTGALLFDVGSDISEGRQHEDFECPIVFF